MVDDEEEDGAPTRELADSSGARLPSQPAFDLRRGSFATDLLQRRARDALSCSDARTRARRLARTPRAASVVRASTRVSVRDVASAEAASIVMGCVRRARARWRIAAVAVRGTSTKRVVCV